MKQTGNASNFYHDRDYVVPLGSCLGAVKGMSNLRDRKPVAGFSRSSYYRIRKYLRNAVAKFRVFVTLTLPTSELDRIRGNPYLAKRWLGKFHTILSREIGDVTVLWKLEFTGAGVPHYHLACDRYIPKAWLSDAWWRACGKISASHRKSGTNVKQIYGARSGAIRYMSKYISKQEVGAQDYSGFGRVWGIWGDRSVVSRSTIIRREDLADAPLEDKQYLDRLSDRIKEKIGEYLAAGLITLHQATEFIMYCRIAGIQGRQAWHVLTKMLRDYDAFYRQTVERARKIKAERSKNGGTVDRDRRHIPAGSGGSEGNHRAQASNAQHGLQAVSKQDAQADFWPQKPTIYHQSLLAGTLRARGLTTYPGGITKYKDGTVSFFRAPS